MTYEEKKKQLAYFTSLIADRHYEGWLISELEKAWAALEFYADNEKYRSKTSVTSDNWVEGDLGKRAREALGTE